MKMMGCLPLLMAKICGGIPMLAEGHIISPTQVTLMNLLDAKFIKKFIPLPIIIKTN